MTDSSAVAASPTLVSSGNWPWRIAIVTLLAAFADWLFFRQYVGVSLALFIGALGVAVLVANGAGASGRERILYAGILVGATLPGFEDINVMSVLIAAFGIGCFALGMTGAFKGGLVERFMTVGWFLASGPLQLVRDLPLLRQWASERGAPASLGALKGWVLPLGFGAVFVALFAAANPVIAHWLTQWSAGDTLKQLDLQRLMFWCFIVIAVWGLVGVSGRFALPKFEEAAAQPPLDIGLSPIFTDTAIMRSLVLFNLLFAVQTVMDVHYLWRGAALPDGMTHATYAHRGAYPLIVTALLAAGFVLAAMRAGSDAERSPLMRALVFLWVGQNVLLVVSAILRLNLYVETYLLTYWRVAAFIWMVIVAAGLILIVTRIVLYRSNAWLIAANLVVLALTLYICSFVNFASLVARYNIAQSLAPANAGRPVDLNYIVELGPQAIPALDRYIAANPGWNPRPFRAHRDNHAVAHAERARSWRAWTFRGWRLTRYLEASKSAPALTPL
ncbi:MAG TPA: DUF4173 domain-containing protein [Xanthobacteraceae bacterium]|nr:DUF4173 domain-containing protein [Xanthobacteraceae bacterium]